MKNKRWSEDIDINVYRSYTSIYLSIHPSIYPSSHLSVIYLYPSFFLFLLVIYISIYPYTYIHIYIYRS